MASATFPTIGFEAAPLGPLAMPTAIPDREVRATTPTTTFDISLASMNLERISTSGETGTSRVTRGSKVPAPIAFSYRVGPFTRLRDSSLTPSVLRLGYGQIQTP